MKKLMYLVCTALMLAVAPSAKAQFVVTDPANLASGILNSANEIVQTSSTVSNVIKNFVKVVFLFWHFRVKIFNLFLKRTVFVELNKFVPKSISLK